MIAALVLAAFVEHSAGEHRYQVWLPENYTASRKWPAILFLHGAGERGADNHKQIEVGMGPALQKHPIEAIVIFPQCPEEGYWAGPERAIAMEVLADAMRRYSIDRERVSLTGMSMGGTGTWILAAEHPRRFSAIAPICAWVSGPPPFRVVQEQPKWLSFDEVVRRIGNVPTWIFHGAKDNVVPPSESRAMIDRLGANAAYTEFPNANHNSWDPAYSGTTVLEWLIKQKRL